MNCQSNQLPSLQDDIYGWLYSNTTYNTYDAYNNKR